MYRIALLAISLVATIALGIASRKCPIGLPLFDKSLGDALYAVAAYLEIAMITRWPPSRVAVCSVIFCLAIETFKLTGLPLEYQRLWFVPWIFGSVFSGHNVVCYVCGIAVASFADGFVCRKLAARSLSDRAS